MWMSLAVIFMICLKNRGPLWSTTNIKIKINNYCIKYLMIRFNMLLLNIYIYLQCWNCLGASLSQQKVNYITGICLACLLIISFIPPKPHNPTNNCFDFCVCVCVKTDSFSVFLFLSSSYHIYIYVCKKYDKRDQSKKKLKLLKLKS